MYKALKSDEASKNEAILRGEPPILRSTRAKKVKKNPSHQARVLEIMDSLQNGWPILADEKGAHMKSYIAWVSGLTEIREDMVARHPDRADTFPECRLCDAADETFDHMFRCKNTAVLLDACIAAIERNMWSKCS